MPETELKNLHILIVDDDASARGLVAALLQTMGVAQIVQAENGGEAFQKLLAATRVVDCILCDYSMDNGNGLQLLQAIRMGQVKNIRPDTCFVLVTSSGAPQTVTIAAELDISGYLVKPVTPDKLKTAITKARSRAIKINFQKYGRVVVPII